MSINIQRADILPDNDKKHISHSIYEDCSKAAVLLLAYRGLTTMMAYLFYEITYIFFYGKPTDLDTVVQKLAAEKKELILSTFYSMLLNSTVTVTALLCTLVIGKLMLRFSFRGFMKPKVEDFKTGLYWAPACFLMNIGFSMAVNAFTSAMGSIGVNIPEADFSIKKPTALALLLQFLYIVILAPLIEEILYRGVILGSLAKYGQGTAILVSAVCFGLMHGNIPQAVSAFGTGLIYAVIAINCGSIYPSLMIHMINNLLVNMEEMGDSLNIPQMSTVAAALQVVIAVLGLYIIMTRYSYLRCDKEQALPGRRAVLKKVFSNPIMVAYMLFLVWSVVSGIIRSNV